MPLSERDFLSHAELGMPSADQENCTHWGLSVWRSSEAVTHARSIIPFMKKWSVARGQLHPEDGVMAPTPSEKQPEHFTFWKANSVQIAARFILDDSFGDDS